MPKKLKKLNITKVDFVDAGANQRANIAIFKRALKGGENMGSKKDEFEKLVQAAVLEVTKRLGREESPKKVSAVKKGSQAITFGDAVNHIGNEKIYDEIWDTMDALRCSLMSIIQDGSVENKTAMLKQSLAEFKEVADQFADSWGNLQTAKVAKYFHDLKPSDLLSIKARSH